MQNTSRRTVSLCVIEPASPITDLNVPVVRSSMRDAASGMRSSDLGCISTSGRRAALWPWRRNTWKYCAGVDGYATTMLLSAHNCRNRSRRALECSGP